MTTADIDELNAALRRGAPLTTEQLAWHLQIDPKHAPRIEPAFGLEPEGRLYPWVNIWRAIHATEGVQLAQHLQDLKAKYSGSVILCGIEDLEAEFRMPLIDFAAMSEKRGRKHNTLSKVLREGRETLPFPIIDMGPRTRHFRALEVRLWVRERICLELPKPPSWATTTSVESSSVDDEGTSDAADPTMAENTPAAVDPAKKAIFGGFGGDSRNLPT
ncbi:MULTISPECIES: hypothetical protein [Limimaricola]|uniref:Uncharacterized protein n=2 Tax=Limimaricola TaxID=2211638 RepID=A0A2G1MBY6_9RHOB|nr:MULTISPECIES: hypothetical protein [Limimaricola]MCP1168571.1 hypothetical protein [Limimaricola litoreus]PHP26249.1 hypothetical protein CJ301_17400 [Limimaricola cinnabarinus]